MAYMWVLYIKRVLGGGSSFRSRWTIQNCFSFFLLLHRISFGLGSTMLYLVGFFCGFIWIMKIVRCDVVSQLPRRPGLYIVSFLDCEI